MDQLTIPECGGVFYGLDAELYHAAPGLSHSMTKHLNPPARLPVYMSQKREPTAAMIMGTLVHQMVLEPDKPLPRIALKPEGMKFSTTEGKAWKKDHAGLLILTQTEWDTLHGCVRSIAEHPDCRDIFGCEGKSEVSIFTPAETTRMRLMEKLRLDWVPVGSALVDIKTVPDEGAGKEEFSKILFDQRYYTQASWYLKRWNRAMPDEPKEHFVFVTVEKAPPYLVQCHTVDPEALAIGYQQNAIDESTFIDCSLGGVWPGYPTGCGMISIPKYERLKILNRDHSAWSARVLAAELKESGQL
jgi:hypothetical protein